MVQINSPWTGSLGSECRKAGRILASFVDPKQSFGPDKVIPPSVLANAKGLCIITVLKAGFLFSGRVGSGLVIARLPDGSWSAPSAIVTAGAGFGGQIGAELTDFVMILNNAAAVRAFSQLGNITLGGNVSIAAGPIGRNAEASGTASKSGVAGVFSYSKTKGLFAGVSLEGSVLVERRDLNSKLYGSKITAKRLLEGGLPPPPAAEPLLRVLNSRVFRGNMSTNDDSMYNDMPVYGQEDDVVWEGQRGEGYNENVPRRQSRSSTWQDDVYDRNTYNENPGRINRSNTVGSRADPDQTFDRLDASRNMDFQRKHFNSTYSDNGSVAGDRKGPAPGRPTAPKPVFKAPSRSTTLGANQAVALFTFDADQPGDLGFKKGDIITITKKSDSKNDWWTGQIGSRTGIFPSNYVESVN